MYKLSLWTTCAGEVRNGTCGAWRPMVSSSGMETFAMRMI